MNLPELIQWEDGIYQLELTDPVVGGENGVDNRASRQLANRTQWLKYLIEQLSIYKQPLDQTLTAIAALVTAADKLIYSTGVDTFAQTTLTAFARSLLDDADAAAARTTLGLGSAATTAASAYQPADATLNAIAALVTAADKLIYSTGVDTFAQTALTAFARSLLDDADAAAARTTLGLGSAATTPSSAYQPADGTLSAIAALVTAADKLIYSTGVDTFAQTALTDFARSLLDDADAVTARATLGAASSIAIGSFKGAIPSNGNLALTPDDCGKVIIGNAAGTIYLPPGGLTWSGASIFVQSISPGVIVERSGLDNIYPGGASLTALDFVVGDYCKFTWFPGYGWVATGTQSLEYGDIAVFGPGQSAVNVTGSRALNAVYTHTGKKPLVIRVLCNGDTVGSAIGLRTNGSQGTTLSTPIAGQSIGLDGIVMPGETYEVASSGSVSLLAWHEVK